MQSGDSTAFRLSNMKPNPKFSGNVFIVDTNGAKKVE
jgi:hypothetical protein